MKVETPFGNMETSTDPDKTAEELGIEIYPGAQVQKAGTASVTFGSLHTVTANFESSDRWTRSAISTGQKFPSAQVSSSDQNRCSIISGEKGNSTTITVQPNGDGSRFYHRHLDKEVLVLRRPGLCQTPPQTPCQLQKHR